MVQDHEELGERGEASQVETVSDENKSLMWVLLKQLRPGMDLSRVVLPTFVLEPRSFLNKLSDYYYHADLLSRCAMGRARHPPPRGCRGSPGDGPCTLCLSGALTPGRSCWTGRVGLSHVHQGLLPGEPSTLCAPEPWHCALRLNKAEGGRGPAGSGACRGS